MMSINLGHQVQIAHWRKVIDSIEKTSFATEFIDKIHLTFNTETDLPKTIDVKKLKALDVGISMDKIDNLIDAALFELDDKIKRIDVTVDVEAVMTEGVSATQDYLSRFNPSTR